MRTSVAWALGLCLVTTALTAGCPGKLRDPSRFLDGGGGAGPCPDVPTAIFAVSCGSATCHAGATPAQGLDLVSPGLAARVVARPATECAGVLVDPTDPEGSILYRKLEVPPCGARMPLGLDPLSADAIACVREWIAGLDQSGGDAGLDAPADAPKDATGQ